MKRFKIKIQEILSLEKTIKANSFEEALEIAQQQYYDQEIVLDAGHFIEVDFLESTDK